MEEREEGLVKVVLEFYGRVSGERGVVGVDVEKG